MNSKHPQNTEHFELPDEHRELIDLNQRWEREFGLKGSVEKPGMEFEAALERVRNRAIEIPENHPAQKRSIPISRPSVWAALAIAAALTIWAALGILNRIEEPVQPDWAVLETVGTETLMLELEPTVVYQSAPEDALDSELEIDWNLDESELDPSFWDDAESLLLEI